MPRRSVPRIEAEPRDRMAHTEVTVEVDVGVAEAAHDDVVGRPRADALQFEETLAGLGWVDTGMQFERAVGDGRGEPSNRVTTSAGHRECVVGCVGDRRRRREREPHALVARARLGRRRHELGRHRARPGDRHLLPDHGPDRGFERIDAARSASARRAGHEWSEDGVGAQRVVDGDRVGVEVEQPA